MLIVNAYITVQAGKETEFITKTRDLIAQTRLEEGNISYALLQSTEDKTEFTFMEQWKSKHDLDLHMQTAHYQAFAAFAPEYAAAPVEIKVYDANPFQP